MPCSWTGCKATADCHGMSESINRHIIIDNKAYYLLFLQDMFPYFDKYLDTDYLPELVERMEYVMNLMDEAGKSDGANKPCNLMSQSHQILRKKPTTFLPVTKHYY